VREHELDAPRPSEMKFDALSGEQANSSRGARPGSGSSPADRAQDWLAVTRRHPKPTGAASNRDFAATRGRRLGSLAGSPPAHGGHVGEPQRGHQKGRGHIVGRENADLACFGELPGRTGCRNANRRPRRSKRPHHGRHARPGSLETPAI